MTAADQLTVARAVAVPVVVTLFAWPFAGRIARASGRTSPFGSLLDPVADKLLVLATLVVLLDQHVFPAWMVAAIVARELLVSGLRLAALERGVVIAARDLGKL